MSEQDDETLIQEEFFDILEDEANLSPDNQYESLSTSNARFNSDLSISELDFLTDQQQQPSSVDSDFQAQQQDLPSNRGTNQYQASNDTSSNLLSFINNGRFISSSGPSSDGFSSLEFPLQRNQRRGLTFNLESEFVAAANSDALFGYDSDQVMDFDSISPSRNSEAVSSLENQNQGNTYLLNAFNRLFLETRPSINHRRIWSCNQCNKNDFKSRTQLSDHKKSVHVNSICLRSRIDHGRILTHLYRDPLTSKFECRCGGSFKSTSNALRHRKCYEIPAMTVNENFNVSGNILSF